jgi:hypothetical protein
MPNPGQTFQPIQTENSAAGEKISHNKYFFTETEIDDGRFLCSFLSFVNEVPKREIMYIFGLFWLI